MKALKKWIERKSWIFSLPTMASVLAINATPEIPKAYHAADDQ
jgi:hypothetical protein